MPFTVFVALILIVVSVVFFTTSCIKAVVYNNTNAIGIAGITAATAGCLLFMLMHFGYVIH